MERRTLLAALALTGAVLAVAVLWRRSEPAPTAPAAVSSAPPASAGPAAPQSPADAAPSPSDDADADGAEAGAAGPFAGLESVDLEEVRRALPHNRYWESSAPTENVRTIQQREEDEARWNVEYGKVLSGTASDAEIDAYFAHRQRTSADSVEFASYLLDHYGDKLSERDAGLLELARRLHLARLQELPKKIEEARARKRKQDAAREAWLADEKAFDPAAAH